MHIVLGIIVIYGVIFYWLAIGMLRLLEAFLMLCQGIYEELIQPGYKKLLKPLVDDILEELAAEWADTQRLQTIKQVSETAHAEGYAAYEAFIDKSTQVINGEDN